MSKKPNWEVWGVLLLALLFILMLGFGKWLWAAVMS